MSEERSARDSLRGKTVGAQAVFKSKRIMYDGAEIEIREPSVKAWGAILKQMTREEGKMEFDQYLVWSVILCAFVPGTDIKVYDDTDFDALMGQPKSGFMTEFSDVASDLMKVDQKEIEGNLNVTTGDKVS